MIVLTAEIEIKGDNPSPFKLGNSKLGSGWMGERVDVVQQIDKRSMLSLDCNHMSVPEVDKPSFGLVSNSGNISFVDYNKSFLGYAMLGLLNQSNTCKVYLKNTVSKTTRLMGIFYAQKWSYDANNKQVSVSLTDGLERMQNILMEEYSMDIPKGSKRSIETILDDFVELVEKNGFAIKKDYSDAEFSKFLTLYPSVSQGNLWQQYSKVLAATGLNGYIERYGELRVF